MKPDDATHPDLYFAFPGSLTTLTGGYQYDRRLIAELRRLGITVTPVALSEAFPFPNEDEMDHARETLKMIPNGSVIIIDGLAFGSMESIAEKEKDRLCIIALCHHPLAMETGLQKEQTDALAHSEKAALRCAQAIIVTSQNTRKILETDYAVPNFKISVALPGTDSSAFAKCEGTPPRLLTVASLIKRKGHDILVDSLKIIENLQWEARFVGDKDIDSAWAQSLQAKTKSNQLSERITFAGTVDDLSAEYQNADVFVLPSRFEGYGMVLAEAVANGLPIISTSAGPIPDVAPKSASLLVTPEDPLALSKALTRVITEKDVRIKMQLSSRVAAANLPSWSDCGNNVLKCIESVS